MCKLRCNCMLTDQNELCMRCPTHEHELASRIEAYTLNSQIHETVKAVAEKYNVPPEVLYLNYSLLLVAKAEAVRAVHTQLGLSSYRLAEYFGYSDGSVVRHLLTNKRKRKREWITGVV